MDSECFEFCKVLNQLPGIRTFESCCGHRETPYRIWFIADNLESLPDLLYWFDG